MAYLRARASPVLGTALALAVVLAGTPAAHARWYVHNDVDVTEIKAPRGFTQKQTCAHRLRGRTGWSELVPSGRNPNTYGPLPALAFGPVRYQVWKAPAGFRNFVGAEEIDANGDGVVDDYLFTDANGNQFSSTLVRQFRTEPRVRLRPAEQVHRDDPGPDKLYVLTSASFAPRFRPGTVRPGDVLGVRPRADGSTLIKVSAVRCRR